MVGAKTQHAACLKGQKTDWKQQRFRCAQCPCMKGCQSPENHWNKERKRDRRIPSHFNDDNARCCWPNRQKKLLHFAKKDSLAVPQSCVFRGGSRKGAIVHQSSFFSFLLFCRPGMWMSSCCAAPWSMMIKDEVNLQLHGRLGSEDNWGSKSMIMAHWCIHLLQSWIFGGS